MFLRTEFNYDMKEQSDASALVCPEPSLTVQSDADDADINTIVRRFGVTGQLPMGVRAPSYEDFSDVGDFQEAVNAVRKAEESFMEMPAEVRSRFNNDPQRFVGFCSDESNFDEMHRLGLVLPEAHARRAAQKAADAKLAVAMEPKLPAAVKAAGQAPALDLGDQP